MSMFLSKKEQRSMTETLKYNTTMVSGLFVHFLVAIAEIALPPECSSQHIMKRMLIVNRPTFNYRSSLVFIDLDCPKLIPTMRLVSDNALLQFLLTI